MHQILIPNQTEFQKQPRQNKLVCSINQNDGLKLN